MRAAEVFPDEAILSALRRDCRDIPGSMVGDAWRGTHEPPVGHLVNQELGKIASGELRAELGLSIPTDIDIAIGRTIL